MKNKLGAPWVDALVSATADRSGGVGEPATVAITVGKTSSVVFTVADGRVVGAAEVEVGDADVSVPVTMKQLDSLVAGTESLAQAYMRGDIKPVGASGPLLSVVELFEDPTVRSNLQAGLAESL